MEKIKPEYLSAEAPQVIVELGSGKPQIIFNVGTHGNEVQPLYAVEEVLNQIRSEDLVQGSVKFTLSNPPALRQNRRYLSTDLNRAYPGNIDGVGEVRLAAQMLPLVQESDYLIDMHTAPTSPPVVILGKRDPQRLALAELSGIQPIVLFEAPVPCAMVDFVKCGIGLELGTHNDPNSKDVGVRVMQNYLKGLGFVAGEREIVQNKYYEVIGEMRTKDIEHLPYEELSDFQPIDQSKFPLGFDEEVYPFLTGMRTYTPIFSFLVRQVQRDYMTHY